MNKNIFFPNKKRKPKGQSMVEFALVLPVLLVLVFGLMEAGRLLFIYGSVTTASREAVRYGSATGDNGSGTPKYLDCTGIQTAAETMGFILPISSVDIIFTRGGTTFADCDTSSSTFPNPSSGLFQNGDRIEVISTSAYTPMVPLVPFGNFDITTESKRTIFIGITIDATPSTPGLTPTISLTAPADQTYSTSGETISYTFTIDNTGTIDLTTSSVTVSITRESDGVEIHTNTCNTGAITAGNNNTCVGSYTTTGTDDADLGTNLIISGSATGSDGTDTATASDNSLVTFTELPALTLNDITVTPTSKTSEGFVTYTYDLTNSGNVPLSNFTITDTGGLAITSIDCMPSGLAVGTSTGSSCTAQYWITDPTDLDAGSVTHNASIQAEYSGTPTTPVSGNVTVYTQPLALVFTSAIPSPYAAEGDVTFTFQLSNYSGTDMDNPVIDFDLARLDGTSASPASTTLTCSTPLAITITCSGTYAITQGDLDAGGIILRNTTASATQGAETLVSNTLADFTIYADEEIEFYVSTALKADGVPISSGDTVSITTSTLEYTYSLDNQSNISIPAGTVYEIKENGVVVCTKALNAALAPATTTPTADQCVRSYPVVDPDDLDAGSIISPVIGYIDSISWGGSTLLPVTSNNTDTATVYTYHTDRLSLDISATVLGSPVNDGDTLDVGDVIAFTYTLTNTGNTTLTPTYALSGGLGTVTCSSGANITPGNSTDCDSTYTILSGDVGTLTNSATASASSGATTSTVDSMFFTVTNPAVCSLSHSGTIPANTKTPSWTFTNNSGTSITVASVTINWHNTNSDRKLKIIRLDGTKIWDSESNSGSEAASGAWAIGNGATANLGIEFGKAPGTYVRAIITFSDPVCSATTLSSP
ncbi:MAG: pilus assembly protein [Anaerolineae bacterium]|jgi:Flp pilus assembly protein TadG|nr:pilus assembly protein [Anaerolineae bacterium]MBT7071305.1 pilus assembly protein [Anaerolineae bacterium]MBT7325929.1 pilus assembly protein [Anaerolineae bacterium]